MTYDEQQKLIDQPPTDAGSFYRWVVCMEWSNDPNIECAFETLDNPRTGRPWRTQSQCSARRYAQRNGPDWTVGLFEFDSSGEVCRFVEFISYQPPRASSPTLEIS